MNITLHCSCLDDRKELSLTQLIKLITSVQKYHFCLNHSIKNENCIKCDKCICMNCQDPNNEFYLSCPKPVTCKRHKEVFSEYCLLCKEDICIHCKFAHQEHKLSQFNSSFIQRRSKANDCNKAIINNKKLKEELMKRLEVPKMKINIQVACETNEFINRNLELLQKIIIKTFNVFVNTPCYNLEMLNTIVGNVQEYSYEGQNIEQEYHYLLHYFQSNIY